MPAGSESAQSEAFGNGRDAMGAKTGPRDSLEAELADLERDWEIQAFTGPPSGARQGLTPTYTSHLGAHNQCEMQPAGVLYRIWGYD